MEQFLQKCWEQFELRFFWHWLDSRVARKIVDHILKTACPKKYQKIIAKIVRNQRKLRSGGCFGRSGSLPGAMLTRLGCRSAKMHARCCQSCPIWCQLGGQVGAKILKKSIKNYLIFVFFFGALLEAKLAPKPLQNGGRNRLQDAFQGAWKRKWWKCDFEQLYHVWAIFWGSPRLGNRRKNWKNLTTILSKLEDALGIDFVWILSGFWRPSWRQNRIKIWLKFDWKFWWKKDQQNEPKSEGW